MKNTSLNKRVVLSVLMILLVLSPFTGSAVAGEPELRVTIKGMIPNIAEVGAYISSQTFLQLYPCETTGRLRIQKNKDGNPEPVPGQERPKFYLDGLSRGVPQSTLSRISLPVFGMFNFFKTRGLEPGKCYKICVMMLDNPYPGMISLTDHEGKPVEIVVPEPEAGEDSRQIVIDMTKTPLSIPLP